MNSTVPVSHSDFEEPEEWDAVHYHEDIDGTECTITAVEMENTVASVYSKYECTECDETYYTFESGTKLLSGIVCLIGFVFFADLNHWIAGAFIVLMYLVMMDSTKLSKCLHKIRSLVRGDSDD